MAWEELIAPRYRVDIKDQSGAKVAVLTDWSQLRIGRRLNGVDSHVLEFDGESALADLIGLDYQIEVWRRDQDAGFDWYREYEGFHRTGVRQTTNEGESLYTSYGVGYNDLINRRIILYAAQSTGAKKSGVGETVIKAYVNENAGPGATFPPRLLASGVTQGLQMEADGGDGSAWEGSRAYQNLLAVVQEIGNATDVDFQVVGITDGIFEFQARAAPWGEDRTNIGMSSLTGLNAVGNAPVIFSLEYGNMMIPVYSLNRSSEVTAAIVLGQGQEASRTIAERTNPTAMTESPWNRIEATRSGTTETTAAGLNAIGDEFLVANQARESFNYQVLQVPSTLYGKDYFLGDLVVARYKTIEVTKKIVGVDIVCSKATPEQIGVVLADVN